jgi:hypothetical protein
MAGRLAAGSIAAMTPVAELKQAHRAIWAAGNYAAEGRWEQCRREMVAMAERRNEATDGSLVMYAEYLIAVGRKPE